MVIHSDVYDYDSDGSARVFFRFSQRYLKLMDVIAEKYNNIPDYEEVMVFLLDCYEERPLTLPALKRRGILVQQLAVRRQTCANRPRGQISPSV